MAIPKWNNVGQANAGGAASLLQNAISGVGRSVDDLADLGSELRGSFEASDVSNFLADLQGAQTEDALSGVRESITGSGLSADAVANLLGEANTREGAILGESLKRSAEDRAQGNYTDDLLTSALNRDRTSQLMAKTDQDMTFTADKEADRKEQFAHDFEEGLYNYKRKLKTDSETDAFADLREQVDIGMRDLATEFYGLDENTYLKEVRSMMTGPKWDGIRGQVEAEAKKVFQDQRQLTKTQNDVLTKERAVFQPKLQALQTKMQEEVNGLGLKHGLVQPEILKGKLDEIFKDADTKDKLKLYSAMAKATATLGASATPENIAKAIAEGVEGSWNAFGIVDSSDVIDAAKLLKEVDENKLAKLDLYFNDISAAQSKYVPQINQINDFLSKRENSFKLQNLIANAQTQGKNTQRYALQDVGIGEGAQTLLSELKPKDNTPESEEVTTDSGGLTPAEQLNQRLATQQAQDESNDNNTRDFWNRLYKGLGDYRAKSNQQKRSQAREAAQNVTVSQSDLENASEEERVNLMKKAYIEAGISKDKAELYARIPRTRSGAVMTLIKEVNNKIAANAL